MAPFLFLLLLFFSLQPLCSAPSPVQLGCERLFEEPFCSLLKGKRIGVVTNYATVTSTGMTLVRLLRSHRSAFGYQIAAFFAPEHGLEASLGAGEKVATSEDGEGIPVFSLHGHHYRPTDEMVKGVELLVYDLPDVGVRAYTYATTLYYLMEEAARHRLPLLVLDRPNPINGLTVDGFLLEPEWKSFLGQAPVPLCHGMTIGELALYYNGECQLGCDLKVIPMQGWSRSMSYADTELPWLPPSPQLPERTSPPYYATTGAIGELQLLKIGVGNTFPFRAIGAPWLEAERLADRLNEQKLPGVRFLPFHFSPQYGKYANELCHGVLIEVTDQLSYLPITTQFLLLGLLKSLYRDKFMALMEELKGRHVAFNRAQGSALPLQMLLEENYPFWPLKAKLDQQRQLFLERRRPYLLYER